MRGIKILRGQSWVQVRASNTELIFRKGIVRNWRRWLVNKF